jgi:hypothetical protein
VLWLKGQAVVAAFEIESTTSIYSGLLRMSDLISMQPNLTMPLYIVAPDEKRDKVKEERFFVQLFPSSRSHYVIFAVMPRSRRCALMWKQLTIRKALEFRILS